MRKPRVMVVSNECLSEGGSNGRTLRNFLVGWPKECLAQFYIHGSSPDFEVCSRYYRVTDRQALMALLYGGNGGGVVECDGNNPIVAEEKTVGRPRRNALTMLVRELVWSSRRWMGNGFLQWTEAYSPQLILLQAGDCAFMFRIAEGLAERYGAPLVIYNSEDYYFKTYDYFRGIGPTHWCYPLFHRHFCRVFERVVKKAKMSVYIHEFLQDAYDSTFSLPSTTIYTATKIRAEKKDTPARGFVVSYLGNLGVGRHKALIEIAEALQCVSEHVFLDVYGKMPDEKICGELEACPGIRYRGFVSYKDVVRIMCESDLLIHAENFDAFYREDLRNAFSTKIADSLASGTCFLLYAPEEMACSQYLLKHEAAHVITDRGELEGRLREIITDRSVRERYLENAARLTVENHCAERNAAMFQERLLQVAEEAV